MNMNSSQMRQAMKRMGIAQEELDARRVVIELDDRDIVIEHPSVAKVKMMGQETFQISGEIHEQSRDATPEINEQDIDTVVAQTGKSREEALQAIQDCSGDLAEAILKLSS
jgi:nascent polypeptide-associated complex subunit alpha